MRLPRMSVTGRGYFAYNAIRNLHNVEKLIEHTEYADALAELLHF